MNPDLLLAVVTALTGFVLKTTLAIGVCWVLSWLANSPSRRFMVWLSFLYGTAAYWLFLAKSILPGGQVAAVPSSIPAPAVRETVRVWQVPSSWAFPVGIALRVLGVVYLLVLTYLLVAHIKKHIQLKWVLGFTSQPPDEVVAAFQPIARNLGVGRSRLLVLAGVTSPATFGWIRPTILLPDTCLEQDRSGLEDILRHELHHVRRLDFVWNGLAIACRALLFFHPAAWYAVSRMQFERELACDLAAVSDSPKRRAKYAECLIHFARLNSSQSSTNWGIDFASSSEHLKARVHSILAESKKSPPWLIGSRIACGLALLAGFVAIEPSLGVLLTYAQRQIVQPLAAEIRTAPPKADTRTMATRKGRLSRGESLASAGLPVANVSQTPESTDFSAPRNADISASTQGDGGPQLLHRGSAAPAKAARRQTVIPIDDPSGQAAKAGDHDHQQALQQTATAAAVLKRLSTFDHH
jgi:beta-lactamase regulating signal transducer with metallopeptidase domain